MKPNIDPKVDCVFKAILGSEEHKPLLVNFLNAVLAKESDIRICTVELINPYNEREFETDKLSVVDVKARDEQGHLYQIEIQLALHPGLLSRILYTWSTIYHGLIPKGKEFTELRPVMAIWLLDETLFDVPGAWHLPFIAYNREYGLKLSDDFRIDILQLPEWRLHEQAQGDLDRWMYLFNEGEDVDATSPPAILQTNEMKEAIGVLQHFSENEREYFLYQQRLEAERLSITWQNEIARSKQQLKQAKQEVKEAKLKAKEAKQEIKEAKLKAKEAEQEASEAKQRAEQERLEKERLLQLLRNAGIDPHHP